MNEKLNHDLTNVFVLFLEFKAYVDDARAQRGSVDQKRRSST